MSRLDRLVRTIVELPQAPQRLRALWRAMFCGNPLLRREMGLWEGRPLWRAPVVWAIVAGMMPLLLRMGRSVWSHHALSIIVSHWDDPLVVQAAREHHSHFITRLLVHSQFVTWILFPLAIIWIVARAWGRDGNESLRDQIGASPLTVSQLISSRVLLWLSIPVVFLVLTCAWGIIDLTIIALTAPRDSVLYATRFSPESYPIHDLYWLRIRTQVSLFAGAGIRELFRWLVLLGLTTRLTLKFYQPLLSLVLVAALLALLHFGEQKLISLIGVGWLTYPGTFHLYQRCVLVLWALAAFFVWRGLPAHVARMYGKG